MAACECLGASRVGICGSDSLSRNLNMRRATDHSFHFAKFCRATLSDCSVMEEFVHEGEDDDLWAKMLEEARVDVEREPILSSYYHASILCHQSLETALANHLSLKLSSSCLPSGTLTDLFVSILNENEEIVEAVKHDLRAVKKRDPACISYVHCFLNFKGLLAIQAHRIAHQLWSEGRKTLALLIQNRVSEVFAVDIHPGAKIGRGILLDHATGLVVGETAVIGNNVSILHNVTLGGTGKASGDRHPKIGDGVLIGASTCILGNIKIGEGAKIGAGSMVLKDVPSMTTAVGNPARLLGGKANPARLDNIPSFTMDHTSHFSEWSDYVI
ncbi:serine acetyltransferase 1, chloroplastic-like [Neltuma alba]|uniref:serine acetyltransferase 1, chloroplastic-like n=1 Tax=Neltuma alba TaxID=207710 RepID=UPI0010A3A6BA|nr:serine acetyltransferase 1, chloroplastic-like [Prosopis alba]